MGVVRHGIEEMPFEELCDTVDEMMVNADENGHPVWGWEVPAIANSLLEYDDAILACHVNDVLAAVEEGLRRYRMRVTNQMPTE
jgi:hypothetical protein